LSASATTENDGPVSIRTETPGLVRLITIVLRYLLRNAHLALISGENEKNICSRKALKKGKKINDLKNLFIPE